VGGAAAATRQRYNPKRPLVAPHVPPKGYDAPRGPRDAAQLAAWLEEEAEWERRERTRAARERQVLPSYREGTPKSTLEALATGRAVITTDAPGCRETVERGVNGVLVPPRDARALAEACLRFAPDAALRERMGAASRALAERRFDARAVNATIIEALGA
jgi:hypothetical protein